MFFENSIHCLPNIPNVKNSSNVGSNKQQSRQNRQIPVLLQVYIAFSSPGLLVIGGDSRYESCEFDSRPCILTTFFTLICCKMCIVCLKRPKINIKLPRREALFKNSFLEVYLKEQLLL